MKKITTTVLIISASFAANAQDTFDPLKDRQLVFDLLNICSVIFVVYLISSFILQVIRQNFDYRIKSKMIEKETSENIVVQLLQPNKKDPRNNILQWIFILSGIGLGLTLITIFQPFGIHSIAIMAFTIAAGFLGYYYFTKKTDKQ